jgi:DNA replication and repair protein RecF
VDSVISQASRPYLNTLIEYNRILRQRSALLTLLKEQRRSDYLRELDAWSTQLLEAGKRLIEMRIQFCGEFTTRVKEAYVTIMRDEEIPRVEYFTLGEIRTDVKAGLFEAMLSARREEEIRRGANLVGPHRDDFIFAVNNVPLKQFGSQGQHKTFQVALRFAEFFYLKEKSGETPIFLLDDVFGVLDTKRSIQISDCLQSVGQAFVTITDFSNYRFLTTRSGDATFLVQGGAVSNG